MLMCLFLSTICNVYSLFIVPNCCFFFPNCFLHVGNSGQFFDEVVFSESSFQDMRRNEALFACEGGHLKVSKSKIREYKYIHGK